MRSLHLYRPGWARRFAAALAIVALAGCDVTGVALRDAPAVPASFSIAQNGSPASLATIGWWTEFDDPTLNSLVDRGFEQNLTLLQVLERVRAAEAVAAASGRPFSSSGSAQATESGASNRDSTFNKTVGASASYIVDLFGGLRNRRARDQALLAEALENQNNTRLLFLSSITEAYVDLRFFQLLLQSRQADVTSRQLTLRNTRTLLDSGEATQLDLAQSQASLSTAEAEIPLQRASIERQKNRIATLLGLPAGTLDPQLSAVTRQPVPSTDIIIGVPADLIRNRPDVRAAEQRYLQAFAEIGIRRAALYPSLQLGGSIQASQQSGNEVQTWSFGPTLNIPIFNQGALRADVTAAEARAREAYLFWTETVLQGIEEVETALVTYRAAQQAAAKSGEAVQQNERALRLSRSLVTSGEITLLQIIELERRLADARTDFRSNLRQTSRDYITLMIALGAGYNVPPLQVASAE